MNASPLGRAARSHHAFSLVEVVLALGIAAFCLIALLSLMSTAMKSDAETRRIVDASATASLLLQARRIDPYATGTSPFGGLALPGAPAEPSSLSASNVMIDAGGMADAADPSFAMTYRVERLATNSNICRIFLRLSTPPQAADSRSQSHYEVVSSVRLP